MMYRRSLKLKERVIAKRAVVGYESLFAPAFFLLVAVMSKDVVGFALVYAAVAIISALGAIWAAITGDETETNMRTIYKIGIVPVAAIDHAKASYNNRSITVLAWGVPIGKIAVTWKEAVKRTGEVTPMRIGEEIE